VKSKISALIDDELGAGELDGILAALRNDSEALETWRIYHLLGDAMRDARPLSAGFSERLSRRLAQEPVVVAPRRIALKPTRTRWVALSAAASFAAIALVGWVAFAPGPDSGALTGSRTPLAQTQTAVAAKTATRLPSRSLTGAARDYLLAHQAYSPRAAVQGITPYVQTVSDTAARSGSK
jgi:sigma-E factor negative regulatory protein RseA